MGKEETQALEGHKNEALRSLFGSAQDNAFKRFVIMALWAIVWHLYKEKR